MPTLQYILTNQQHNTKLCIIIKIKFLTMFKIGFSTCIFSQIQEENVGDLFKCLCLKSVFPPKGRSETSICRPGRWNTCRCRGKIMLYFMWHKTAFTHARTLVSRLVTREYVAKCSVHWRGERRVNRLHTRALHDADASLVSVCKYSIRVRSVWKQKATCDKTTSRYLVEMSCPKRLIRLDVFDKTFRLLALLHLSSR